MAFPRGRWAALLTGLLLAAAASAVEPGPITVLCLGDSLTEGYGLAPEESFPARLQERLRELGRREVKIVNAGISGSTSASAVSRLRWQLRAAPDVLILELGGNDGLRGLSLEQTRENLRGAIRLARQQGVRVLLAGMQIPPNYGLSYTGAFREMYPQLAREEEVALIPFLLEGVAGRPELNLPDGIHPNAKGQELVADTVLEHLLPLL